ncbi:MAG: AMP-binding protein [Nocardioides sp.]|nr:AMP-binding protein [Nocardioides sp.]
MQLTWFRAPTGDDAGTTNLCYEAVDLQIVRGRAVDVAVRQGEETIDFANLLERVAALAGVMRGMGVTPGARVAVLLDDPLDELLAFLAAARIGAVHVALPEADPGSAIDRHTPALVVTSRVLTYADHTPPVVILRGPPPEDARRDLDWEVAVKAGRTDPAGTEPVAGDTTAYVLLDEAVPVSGVPGHDSRFARQLADLAAGRVIILEGSPE